MAMTTFFSIPTPSTTALAKRPASAVVVCIFQLPMMNFLREFVGFILVIVWLAFPSRMYIRLGEQRDCIGHDEAVLPAPLLR